MTGFTRSVVRLMLACDSVQCNFYNLKPVSDIRLQYQLL